MIKITKEKKGTLLIKNKIENNLLVVRTKKRKIKNQK